jgi:hypothetical protein
LKLQPPRTQRGHNEEKSGRAITRALRAIRSASLLRISNLDSASGLHRPPVEINYSRHVPTLRDAQMQFKSMAYLFCSA